MAAKKAQTGGHGYAEIKRDLASRGVQLSLVQIRAAHRKGWFDQEPDGSWDMEKVIAGLRDNRTALKITDPDFESVGTGGNDAGSTPQTSWRTARAAKELIDVKRRQIQLDVARAKLIDRETVLNEVGRLADEMKTHWLNFSSRNAAEIAAELGVPADLAMRVLDKYVVEHGRGLGAIEPDRRI